MRCRGCGCRDSIHDEYCPELLEVEEEIGIEGLFDRYGQLKAER